VVAHDLQPSAVTLLVALLHSRLERIFLHAEVTAPGCQVRILTSGSCGSSVLPHCVQIICLPPMPRQSTCSSCAAIRLRYAPLNAKRACSPGCGRCAKSRDASQRIAAVTLHSAVPSLLRLLPQIFNSTMYAMIREAPRLASLEMHGRLFPFGLAGKVGFEALAGVPLRHLVLDAASWEDDRTCSEEPLVATLADLPQLQSLEMSFSRCGSTAAMVA